MPFDEELVRKKKIENEILALEKERQEIQTRLKKPVIAKIVEMMNEFGISLDEVRSALRTEGKARKATNPVAIKYRHPETGQTWTGRGKAPKWLADAEAEGRNRDEFLVDAA